VAALIVLAEPLTEEDWLASASPLPLLSHLGGSARSRKLRHFAVACYRRHLGRVVNETSRQAIEVAERQADGLATEQELRGIRKSLAFHPRESSLRVLLEDAEHAAQHAVKDVLERVTRPACSRLVQGTRDVAGAAAEVWAADSTERKQQAALIREIFGNPFRPATVDLRWLAPLVVQIAKAIYEQRAFHRLPELARALEEAGCDQKDILAHCKEPIEHVRGCWALDVVLGMA
jgi:hypothetical protein